jgi:hypothetical protein
MNAASPRVGAALVAAHAISAGDQGRPYKPAPFATPTPQRTPLTALHSALMSSTRINF